MPAQRISNVREGPPVPGVRQGDDVCALRDLYRGFADDAIPPLPTLPTSTVSGTLCVPLSGRRPPEFSVNPAQ